MTMHVVLIDFENVQPAADWQLLSKEACVVRIFLGINQRNAPMDMVGALQPLGKSIEYVRCQHAGKNALDFLLTFHLGQLAAAYRDERFWIVSKDQGFDSLVKHIRDVGVSCNRVTALAEIFTAAIAPADAESRLQKSIDFLGKMKKARPRTTRTLRSTLQNLFKGIDDAGLETLLAALHAKQVLSESDGKISYSLPPG